MSLRKCKLKQQDTTTNPLEWPKSRALTANAGEDMEQQKLSLLLVGIQNGTAGLVIAYKTKYTLYIPYSNHAPKGVENLCPHKKQHTDKTAALFIITKIWKKPR